MGSKPPEVKVPELDIMRGDLNPKNWDVTKGMMGLADRTAKDTAAIVGAGTPEEKDRMARIANFLDAFGRKAPGRQITTGAGFGQLMGSMQNLLGNNNGK